MENIDQTKTEINDIRKIRATSLIINKGLLVVLSPNFFGKTYILDGNSYTLGRSPDCDFVLNDSLVSKNHFLISYSEGKYFIVDNKSLNGTLLNEKILKKSTALFYGDKIAVGSTILRFYFEETMEK